MTYYILHVRHAIGQSLIAHIHSITACLRDLRLIGSPRFMTLAHGTNLTHGALKERVLAVTIHSIAHGKTFFLGSLPLLTAVVFYISTTVVVVYQHFVLLPVALAWSINHSSGTLKHRNEIRHNDGLSEKIFGSAKQIWALPTPA